MRRAVILGLVVTVIGLGLAVRGWALSVSDASPYERMLDSLTFPASWHLADASVWAPGRDKDCSPILFSLYCPSVQRF